MGHRHPDPPADHLDVQFVGLDMLEIHLPALHPMLVDPLTMPARPCSCQAVTVRSSKP